MSFQVAVAQIKPRKADYEFNLARIGGLFEQVSRLEPRPEVLALPETVLTGYFLEGGVGEVARSSDSLFNDLLRLYRDRAPAGSPPLDVIAGFYEVAEGKHYNSALYATLTSRDNESASPGIVHVHRKFFLPTYGVFDENRFVARGRTIQAFDTRFGRAAVLICEDVWHSLTATIAAVDGAQVIYVISASPGRDFSGQEVGNLARWGRLLPGIADEHNLFVVYAGLVGFEGGKGFTGSSCMVDPWGRALVSAPAIDECIVQAAVDLADVTAARAASPLLADLESSLPDLIAALESAAQPLRGPRGGSP